MRKTSIFLSTLLLAAMLLTACGAEETSTNVPGTDVPTIVPEMTATEAAGPTDGTTTPEIPVTGGEDPSRLSNLLDFTVWNQNGEQIGEVNDMVLDLDNTRISYVIVGAGGFLGIGEKDVLVPWDSVELQTGAGDATGGQPNAFILQADPESFNNAPDWDVNDLLPNIGEPAGDWDNDVRNFWESGVLPATPDPNATAAPEATETATEEAGQGEVQPQDLQGVVLASDALGSTVIVNQGQGQNQDQAQATGTPAAPAAGTATPVAGQPEPGRDQIMAGIDDIIVNPESGEIRYIVIDAPFDDGNRWIPVPPRFLQWDPLNEALVIRVDAAALQTAPFFQDGQYPDTTVDGWNSEFDAFWQNQ